MRFFRDESFEKKITIIGVLLSMCTVLAFCLCIVNLRNDYSDLPVFYKGYLGRSVLPESIE
jgi:hypothetical protein